MDDAEQQHDEIQVLSSIYDTEFVLEELGSDYQVFSMVFMNDSKSVEVKLTVKLPYSYPSTSSPTFEVSSPYLNGKAKSVLADKLVTIVSENIGQPILYQLFEEVRQFMTSLNCEAKEELSFSGKKKVEDFIAPMNSNPCKEAKNKEKTIIFSTGQPIIDRKSTFQGHVAEVFDRNDVLLGMQQLKLNTKIERATHNMYAYRIHDGNVWLQDCDDDGEGQAGGRLLHLLQLIEAKNVLVVVSRWYGGIHLGATRFKHINNAARQVLEESGHIPPSRSKRM